MYQKDNEKCVAHEEKPQPYYLQVADRAFDEIISLSNDEMVESFKYLQKKLADRRVEIYKNMEIEIGEYNASLRSLDNGTSVIASGL